MKLNKFLYSVVACTLALSGCDENKMVWEKPANQGDVTISDIPLDLQEKLANYQDIKTYAQQYMPGVPIGLGVGADLYLNNPDYKALADANYQSFTTGNAMKHSSVLNNKGELNFATIDAFLGAIPAEMKVYGHNFIWHTQQRQTYLKSLIAPEIKVEADPSGVANILPNSDFEEGNTNGWGCWGGNNPTQSVSPEGEGRESKYAMKLENPVDGGTGNAWKAQCAYTFDDFLDPEKTYVIQFYAKSNSAAGSIQFQFQNGTTSGSQGGYHSFSVGTDWILCENEFKVEDGKGGVFEDVNRILFNFGEVAATYWIDDVKFGEKLENQDPDAGRMNLITNAKFNQDVADWQKWNGVDDCLTWNEEDGNFGKGCMQVVNLEDSPGSQWNVQIHADLMDIISEGTKFYVSYYIKCKEGEGSVRCSTTGNAHYQGDQVVTSAWKRVEWTIEAAGGDIEGLNFDLGAMANTYYIDDVVVSTDPFSAEKSVKATRAGGITYVLKSDEEKRTALLSAMEEWIKGMAEHLNNRVKEWDVINEPIADGSNGWRGIDGVFGSSDSDGKADVAPVESTESGLSLNWASDHFYWGYYLGKEYATKAFEYARKHCGEDAKLYVNDYNLETSPNKLAALIDFVKYIDGHNETGKPIVDGIGTQMHVISTITKEQVDAMFKAMVATGKLIRITELDVRIGYEATANPSAEQLQAQAETYRMIIESFKENVPAAQQGGITIWGLSDSADEHEFWYKGDTPNIFDAKYARKHAYKGVCDGIAGKDISEDFSGDDWNKAYEDETEK